MPEKTEAKSQTEIARKMAIDAQQKILDRVTELERTNATLQAKSDTAQREIEGLREKQQKDMDKAIDSQKTDWRVIIAGVAVFFSVAGLILNQSQQADQRLLVEIGEAKAAAKSASSKASGVFDEHQAKLEELLQKVPSPSEWITAQAEIDAIQAWDIMIGQRVTVQEGKNERALLLVNNSETAWKQKISDIEKDMVSDDIRINDIASDISAIKSAISGAINEIEAQMRGLNAYVNTVVAGNRQIDAIIWQKVFAGQSMPENDLYSHEIPAKAVVNIGDID